MPLLSVIAKNTMLDALVVGTLSLHSAYHPSGGNEIVGGTPAYARLATTFAAASAGKKILVAGPYSFDIPACTVGWIGMHDLATNFLGMVPNGGGASAPFVVDDTTADTLKCAAHGYLVNDTVVVWLGSAGPLPPGLVEGVIYFVTTVPSVDTLQLSVTLAGAPVDFTVTGNGFLQRIISVDFGGQSAFPVTALTLDATIAG